MTPEERRAAEAAYARLKNIERAERAVITAARALVANPTWKPSDRPNALIDAVEALDAAHA